MSQKQFPAVPRALLEELEQRFPDRMPEFNTTPEDIYRKQGEVRVIRLLRVFFNQQNETILKD